MQLGLPAVLAVVFIVLKLVGVIAWPWIWVLAPLWITAALFVVALAGFGIFLLFALIRSGVVDKHRS